MIRKADQADLDGVCALYDEIHTQEEAGLGATGWIRAIYPTRQTAQAALQAGDLFVALEGEALVAAARINREQVAEYAQAPWRDDAPEGQVMVLHTLVVSPRVKGRGYGSKFVAFYEQYAAGQGCRYLRMDTNARNHPARALYQKLGYTEAGIVPSAFHGLPDVRLVCLEKKL